MNDKQHAEVMDALRAMRPWRPPFVFTCPSCGQPTCPEGLGWRMDHARDCKAKTRELPPKTAA